MKKTNDNANAVARGSLPRKSSPVRLCFAPGPVRQGSLSAGLS